jgi:RNAse (barnase) inhibitor barstar
MKKDLKWLLVLATLIFLAGSVKVYAQTGSKTQVNISVAGIEYDDASFTKLKLNIKDNKKVQDIKQNFSQNTAKLTLSYAGDATALWDEIPADIKQPFKITAIESNRINLQLKNSTATNTAPVTNTATNTATNSATNTAGSNDDCKNCYWDMCKYDVTKSIGGKFYKGTITEYGTVYYNCDNGIVLRTSLNINAYGSTVIAGTDTVLISSGPIGTKWGIVNTDDKNGLLSIMAGADLSMRNVGGYTLIAKNLNTEVGGKTYKDVIVVNYKGYSKDPFFGSNFYSSNYYYAKGIGLVRIDTLSFESDPVAAINKTNNTKTVYRGGSVVKNGIDETLIGLWKYHDAKTNADQYYKFLGDGTFEYYAGSVTEANKSKGINHWKIEAGGYDKNGVATIDLTWAGGGWTSRYDIEKKNEPATKKPALLLSGALLVSADNKPSWK